MRFLIILTIFCAFGANFLFSQDAEFEWGISAQGFGQERFKSIVVDDSGNVFVVGYFDYTVDVDPGPDVYELDADGPYWDMFILKLNAAGEFEWCKVIQAVSPQNINANSVALDSENNLIISGSFQGDVDFDTGVDEHILSATIFSEGFLLKLSPDGEFIWVKRFDGAYAVSPTDVVVDEFNNIYLTGLFLEWMDADPGPEGYALYADLPLEHGLFIIKLDSEANFVWAGSIDGEADQNRIRDLEVDDFGNVVVVGDFSETADFDPSIDVFEFTSTSYLNSFILKLSPDGNFIWAKQITGSALRSQAVKIDSEGSIYSVGYFITADFDPGVDDYYAEAVGGRDGFIQKLSADGDFVFAKTFGSEGQVHITDVFLNEMGEPCVVGLFYESVDFDPGPEILELTSAGSNDGFIMLLSSDGNLHWVKQIHGEHTQHLTDLYIDQDQKIYVMGGFTGLMEFGTDLDEQYLEYSGFSHEDAFILKLSGGSTSGVGLRNQPEALELKIFPNPSNGLINIHLNEISNGGLLRVYSSSGKLIEEISNVESYDKFKFELSAGTYFIHFVSDEQSRMFQFVVLHD